MDWPASVRAQLAGICHAFRTSGHVSSDILIYLYVFYAHLPEAAVAADLKLYINVDLNRLSL